MEHLLTVESLIAFLTLSALEIVLGIDNIVFISILAGKLPVEVRQKAMRIGLALAMVSRILLLLGISWIMQLTKPLFTVFQLAVSGKDMILIGGGLFLIAKSTHEIHSKMDGPDPAVTTASHAATTFKAALIQIMLIDLVFSLDSVITAVGMVKHVPIMIAAIVAAVMVMMLFAGMVSRFVENNPTIKILALAFLLLIGVMLVAEGFHQHFNKGYIYFAMAFSLAVELINMRTRRGEGLKLKAQS